MSTQIDGRLHNVTIQAHFIKAITNIKFPSLFFITWKTNDQKYTAQTGRYSAHQNVVTFEQKITLSLPLTYDKQKLSFVKKDTQIQLNLVSKNRPDQPKLVGRITLNIASMLNDNAYNSLTEFPLEFCSVNASLTASFKVIQNIETDIQVHQLQKSIGQGISFHSTLKVNTQQNSMLERSRQSGSVSKDIVNSRLIEKHVAKKESEQNENINKTPKGIMHRSELKVVTQDKREQLKKEKQVDRKSQETNSARGAKISEALQGSSYKKISSVLSEESKYGEENIKLKVQIQTIKLEINRMRQDCDRIKADYNTKNKECEFNQLELKQKQSALQQSTHQNHVLKAQANRLREEVNALREEAVKTTIKITELKDNLNNTSAQLATSQAYLKRLQVVNQQSSSANKQFTTQIADLQKQLGKYENKFISLEQSKTQLQYQLQLEITQNQQQAQKHHKQVSALTIELQTLQNELKAVTEINNAHQNRIVSLEQQKKRLAEVEEQFLQDRNSWIIIQEQLKEQKDRHSLRVEELEDTLITLNERIRYLQGQSQILAQNCKRHHQQYNKLEEEKNSLLKQAEDKYQSCFTSLEKQQKGSLQLQTEKNTLEQNIDALISKYEDLQTNHQALTSQHTILREQFNAIATHLQEKQKKCSELEEIIISGNQQRQRQHIQASDREKNLQLKIKQWEHEVQYSNEQIAMFEEKIAISEQQLKGRQDLIDKLQEGLNTQIQRTEFLNEKLMLSFEKDQRMKDLLAAMQEEQKRLSGFLEEQEQLDSINQSKLISKQAYINDLIQRLDASQNYCTRLASLLEEKNIEHEMLTLRLENAQSNIKDLQTSNQQQLATIIQMEQKNLEMQERLFSLNRQQEEGEKQHQNAVKQLQKHIDSLHQNIVNLQGNILQLNNQLIEKDNLLIEENSKLQAKEDQSNLLSEHIADLDNKYQELLTAKNQIENQLFLKEQILAEEGRKYTQLQHMYDNISNDQATFDMNKNRQEMREKLLKINELENQLRILGIQVNKIPTLERALKIKTIELNSLKFKDKSMDAESELIKLKDQEIVSLQRDKEHLLNIQREFMNLQHEVSSLRNDIQIAEEERFDVESLANERALALDQAKEENRKLVEQITIIGEKHGELQKMLHQLTSNQGNDPRKQAASLKAENIVLNRKLTDYEMTKQKLVELENISKSTADENGKLKAHASELQAKVNLAQTYQYLRKLIEERVKGKQQQKIIQTIEKVAGKEGVNRKAFEQKIKSLSRDFGRLKVQLLNMAEEKSQDDKVRFIGQIQTCEQNIGAMVLLFD